MNLTLDIISGNGEPLGAARRKIFGPEGGRIGRAPDCEWVLANPYVSRHHATIRWISGTYYIESAGENGVALGTPQELIPKLERRPLKHGDHLFIDEYEISVGLDPVAPDPLPAPGAGAGSGAFVPADDPFGLAPTPGSPVLPDPLGPSSDELDPLSHLGGRGGSAALTAPRPDPGWNHTPGVSDHFAPPEPAACPAQVIPDDWNRTTLGRERSSQATRPQAAVSPAALAEPAAPAPAIPDDWDKTNFSLKSAPAAPRPAPALRPSLPATAVPVHRPLSGESGAGGATAHGAGAGASPEGQAAGAGVRPSGPSGPSAAIAAAAPAQMPAAPGGLDVAALLASAGVDPVGLAPDTADSLGLILRSVVQGMIDVLRARAEIKEQFRLSQTIVKTAENNPLKFAVNAEDALGSLLGKRNPAYLPPVEAFEDAFDDIRFHQLAMLAGMRAGFDHMMSRFDPQQLQESFEKRTRRGGLLSMSAKSRYWEQFTQEYQDLAGDRERAFRRLFAEDFALAYEKQLELLKRTHSKPPR